MNDDRTDLEVSQQCRHLVFGDWSSAAIFVPLRIWISETLSTPGVCNGVETRSGRNPRADAVLNCFLLLPRTWVFQFAGFIVIPQGVAQFVI